MVQLQIPAFSIVFQVGFKTKTPKTLFAMCQAFSLWGYGMMIFLVSKLPDKILTPFPCTLYFTHSKKKNPALGGKTVTPYENENQNENSLTVKH